jgi:RNA polymerase sigma-70 factor (ECF subfamily)
MDLDPKDVERFRLKLRTKVRYQVGAYCPDVDDLVQETLVRFLRFAREDRIRNPGNIGGFLNGVCNNVILEYRRRLWHEEQYESESHEAGQAIPADTDVMDLRNAIDEGLAQLSQRDQAILRSFYLEEKTREEICHELGTTDTQFRVALFRAKERFRKIYREGLKSGCGGNH